MNKLIKHLISVLILSGCGSTCAKKSYEPPQKDPQFNQELSNSYGNSKPRARPQSETDQTENDDKRRMFPIDPNSPPPIPGQ